MPASRDRPAVDADPTGFAVSSVVTSFAPTPELIDNLRLLVEQVDEVVVVDDGSGPGSDDVLTAAADLGARVVRLSENLGIAAALNAGVAALLDAGAGHEPDGIVFFDQDSAIGPGFIRSLLAAHVAATRAGMPVAATAPEFFAGVSQAHGQRDGHLLSRQPIQSGLLVSAVALQVIGPFRDDLFIDLVDTEYTMRAEAHGFVTVAARGLDLPHALGRRVGLAPFGRALRIPGGQAIGFTVSAPFRYYYRVRNRVVVNRAYGRRRPFAIARATMLEWRHYVIVWLAVRERRRFAAILRVGRADGRGGRLGRIPDAVARAAADITWRSPL